MMDENCYKKHPTTDFFFNKKNKRVPFILNNSRVELMFLQEMFMLSLANTFVPNMLQFSSILMNSERKNINTC